MIRVYLDWNIYSYLRNADNEHTSITTLKKNLQKHSDQILIPYTAAHLTDLKQSAKSERGKAELPQDLKFLQSLTNGNCIIHDYIKKVTYSSRIDAEKYFNLIAEDRKNSFDLFENLFKDTLTSELSELGKRIIQQFKSTPSPINREDQNFWPPKHAWLKEIFDGDNMLDVLNGFMKLMQSYQSDPNKYRTIRNISIDELKVGFDYTQENDPINKISNNLLKSTAKKSFFEFADQIIKAFNKNQQPSIFDTFTIYYILLDFFGYYRDRVFNNLVQDSHHAYYGAHCDYFITEDDNTYQKAKILYQHFHINTKVCKAHDFNHKLYDLLLIKKKSEKSTLETILVEIQTSLVLSRTKDGHFNPVDIYKPRSLICDFFNRIQVTHHLDGSFTVYTYKRNQNYSDFYFLDEIKSIVNKLSVEMGIDLNNRLAFENESESEELKNHDWKGRSWNLQQSRVSLDMRKDHIGFTLTMSIPATAKLFHDHM